MRKYIFTFLALTILSSCASVRYQVGVSSIGDDAYIPIKKCLLIPTNAISENQLQYSEFKRYIELTMENIGYEITDNPQDATIAVIIDYGISGPQQNQYSYNAPVFGQTGYSSSRSTGTINSFGNRATINSSTQYTPQYGITGYQTVQGAYTTYTRYLKLVAYDFKLFSETKEEKQIWYSAAVSTGSSADLRRVMPYMITALKPYIGKNSGKVITVNLLEGDEVTESMVGR